MAAIVINVAGSYDDKAIRQAQSSLAKLGGSANDANSKGSKFASTLGKGLKGLAIAGGVAAGAFAGVATTLVAFGKEAQESLSISRSTEAIIKSTGGAAKVTADEVAALAERLSETTGIDDETIQSGQNLLLTFKNVANAGDGAAAIFDRATTAALDLSATGFGSVEGASKMLGKALNDPTKGISALSRAGVTFTQQQKDQIEALQESGDILGAQQVILAEVESQVGGVAEAAASPFDRLNTMLGNFKEQVGMAVLPAITSLVDAIGPVLDQLAGPLGTIAGQLGTMFTEVFASIQPLLPPLLTALTEVVGVLASGFMTAVQALVPAVLPLVMLIADLATRLAPILAPILQKVAGVITLVLDAVMPLLGPLADLVLNIFAKMAPIIDLAIEVVETLVTALQPVFDAVSNLIPPLSTLVDVLFAAIMPILEPLMPLLEVLADVLGTILVKAVALLMTGLGVLITGLSQLAPFILENVSKPVVTLWFAMVEKILEGANAMLGWVPGLGDKLQGAVDAFSGLKDGVLNGIQQAADTVREEGGALGQQLQDQGLAMFNDPNPPKAAASTFTGNLTTGIQDGGKKVVAAAKETGRGLGDGVRDEIAKQAPKVAQDAYDMGKRAANAVKDGAQVSSPSKITLYVGKMIAEGLASGIDGGMKKVTQVARDGAQDALDAIKDKAQTFLDYVDSIRSAVAGFGSITADVPETMTPGNLVGGMRARVRQAQVFAKQIGRLRRLGLNPTSLQEIISAGPGAGNEIAAALLQQGEGAIRQVNRLESQLLAAGASVGQTGAQLEFGTNQTIAGARGVVNTTLQIDSGAVVVNVGQGTSAGDRQAIQRQVRAAVEQALAELAREASRAGSK